MFRKTVTAVAATTLAVTAGLAAAPAQAQTIAAPAVSGVAFAPPQAVQNAISTQKPAAMPARGPVRTYRVKFNLRYVTPRYDPWVLGKYNPVEWWITATPQPAARYKIPGNRVVTLGGRRINSGKLYIVARLWKGRTVIASTGAYLTAPRMA